MRRIMLALLAATLVAAGTLGCSGDPKKDARKGEDKPVPEEKKK